MEQQKSDNVEKVLACIRKDDLIQLVTELVNIPSAGGREGPVGEHILQWLKLQGLETVRQVVAENRINAIGILRGSGGGNAIGVILSGMTATSIGPDSNQVMTALGKLKWLVVMDPLPTTSSEFWKAPNADSASIQTEVFMLPTTHWIEKDGSFVNSGRWSQGKDQVIPPDGEARHDHWILADLYETGFGRPASLIYWARDASWLLYDAEFRSLARRYPGFTYMPAVREAQAGWRGETGEAAAVVDRLVHSVDRLVVYVCGGGDTVNAVRDALVKKGMDRKSVKWEKFW